MLAAGLLGFVASCGDETRDAAHSADGGVEAAPATDSAAAADDAESAPWCPDWPDPPGPEHYCAWTTFLAPGPGGSPELMAWNCEVPAPDLAAPGVTLNEVNLAVDCEFIPYATDPSQPDASWHWNDVSAPTKGVLSETLCESLRQVGFEEILFLAACRPADPL